MPELLLLRHAEASPATLDGDDFRRPLTTHGREAARAAGARLGQQGWRTERLLFSPAVRTRETATQIAAELRIDGTQMLAVPELYLATTRALHEILRSHHGNVRRLMIIGHNPGLSEWGAQLAIEHTGESLPTAGFWRFEFSASTWQKLLSP
jgi:phosphohistidine phosphatase